MFKSIRSEFTNEFITEIRDGERTRSHSSKTVARAQKKNLNKKKRRTFLSCWIIKNDGKFMDFLLVFCCCCWFFFYSCARSGCEIVSNSSVIAPSFFFIYCFGVYFSISVAFLKNKKKKTVTAVRMHRTIEIKFCLVISHCFILVFLVMQHCFICLSCGGMLHAD